MTFWAVGWGHAGLSAVAVDASPAISVSRASRCGGTATATAGTLDDAVGDRGRQRASGLLLVLADALADPRADAGGPGDGARSARPLPAGQPGAGAGVGPGVVVDTAAADLRRIERDLHDGAQARLVALAMDLGLAKEKLRRTPRPPPRWSTRRTAR